MSDERCPTCGQAVRVATSDEGTSYYEPAEVADLRAERDDYRNRWLTLGRVSRKMIDRLEADAERERAARRVVDEALRDALAETDRLRRDHPAPR